MATEDFEKLTEPRLVDMNELIKKEHYLVMKRGIMFHGVTSWEIENTPIIDPETLPIVQELRAELAKRPAQVHAHWERDEKGNLYCSHCKGYEPFGKTKFCGECGAIMVEEVSEC